MAALQSSGMSVHAQEAGLVEEACQTATFCATDPTYQLILALLTGIVTLTLLATFLHIREASSLVTEERERTNAERDAFDAFARHVATLDSSTDVAVQPASSQNGTVLTTSPSVASSPPMDDNLETVANAYQDTVMSVPHYDEEYAESLKQNLAAEFSYELATAVVDGNQLTPELQTALVEQSKQARDRRDRLIEALDRESTQLAKANETLGSIDTTTDKLTDWTLEQQSFNDLHHVWQCLQRLEEKCANLIEHRQEHLQNNSFPNPRAGSKPSLQEYLYQPFEVTHPILADATTYTDRLQTAQHRVLDQLTRRV